MRVLLSHRDIEDLLAAHALYAVDADEAQAVEARLPDCDRCRADLADFRAVVALLPPRPDRYGKRRRSARGGGAHDA